MGGERGRYSPGVRPVESNPRPGARVVEKSPLRLGVIGVGLVSQINHLPCLKKRPDAQVVAICDDDPEKARMVAQHFGIGRTVADWEALCRADDIDAVIIATPNHLHAPMTMAALGYGKHVLCEKPPARNAAEAMQMADAAKKAGKILFYAMNNRFRSDVQVLTLRVRFSLAGRRALEMVEFRNISSRERTEEDSPASPGARRIARGRAA